MLKLRQVASRVQKYFIKLTKAGIPVPGRTPNLCMYTKKVTMATPAGAVQIRKYFPLRDNTGLDNNQAIITVSLLASQKTSVAANLIWAHHFGVSILPKGVDMHECGMLATQRASQNINNN